jgi:hypothetical protein
LSPQDLARLCPADLDRPYSVEEKAKIAAFLARTQKLSETLFADLARLAHRGQI